jgi:hypothetical protein
MSIEKDLAAGALENLLRQMKTVIETPPEIQVNKSDDLKDAVDDLVDETNKSAAERAGVSMLPEVPDLRPLTESDGVGRFGLPPVRRPEEVPESQIIPPERFKGEILTNETGGAYTFQEVLLESSGGAWATFTGARTGTAYEMNLNDTVEVGKVVEITEDSRAGGLRAWTFCHRVAGLTEIEFDGSALIKQNDPGSTFAGPIMTNTASIGDTLNGAVYPDGNAQRLCLKFKTPFSTDETTTRIVLGLSQAAKCVFDFNGDNGASIEKASTLVAIWAITSDFDTSTVTWNSMGCGDGEISPSLEIPTECVEARAVSQVRYAMGAECRFPTVYGVAGAQPFLLWIHDGPSTDLASTGYTPLDTSHPKAITLYGLDNDITVYGLMIALLSWTSYGGGSAPAWYSASHILRLHSAVALP